MAAAKSKTKTKEVNKGGRPPKLTAQEFSDLVEGFIQYCKTDIDIIPSDYRLLQYIKDNSPVSISKVTLDRHYVDRDKGYDEPLKNLTAYREDRLITRMQANPKETTASIFVLKQPRSGGYIDRPQANTGDAEVKITVKLDKM